MDSEQEPQIDFGEQQSNSQGLVLLFELISEILSPQKAQASAKFYARGEQSEAHELHSVKSYFEKQSQSMEHTEWSFRTAKESASWFEFSEADHSQNAQVHSHQNSLYDSENSVNEPFSSIPTEKAQGSSFNQSGNPLTGLQDNLQCHFQQQSSGAYSSESEQDVESEYVIDEQHWDDHSEEEVTHKKTKKSQRSNQGKKNFRIDKLQIHKFHVALDAQVGQKKKLIKKKRVKVSSRPKKHDKRSDSVMNSIEDYFL